MNLDYLWLADSVGLSEKQIKKVIKTLKIVDKHNLSSLEIKTIIEKTKLGISVAFERELISLGVDTSNINIFDKAVLVNSNWEETPDDIISVSSRRYDNYLKNKNKHGNIL